LRDPAPVREGPILAVTVQDVLRLALPPGTTIVGGEAGLRRDVTWAASLRTFPSAFPSLKGGEIVLVSLASLRLIEPPVSLDQMVSRLASRGVSAVAVAGDEAEMTASALLADRIGFPLLCLPSEASLHDLEPAIIRALTERRAELYRQDTEVQRRLTELALRGRGLGAIVQALADMSGKTSSLEDDVRRIRFLCQPSSSVALKRDYVDALGSALSAQIGMPWASGLARGGEQSLFSIPLQVQERLHGRLLTPLAIGSDLVGFLSLVSESTEWDRLDYLMLARAASSCALEMSKERAVVEAESRLRGDFLVDLLESSTVNEEALLERARRLGHDLSLPHTIALWRLDPAKTGSSLASLASPSSGSESRLSAAVRAAILRGQDLSAREAPLVHARGATIACICPASAASGDRSPQALVERVRRFLGDEFPGASFSAGFGRPKGQVRDLRTAYQEAEQALSVAQRLFGGDCTSCFADLGFYRLLLPLHGSGDLQGFYSEILGTLEAYDQQNHTDLILTLDAYFRCNGNQQVAAQELCLHRNTLAYRLRRIQELSGLSLDNLEDRFQLQLALKIKRVI
jgi:PucR family transcriptional regulator, purine catabolism regulatory protein